MSRPAPTGEPTATPETDWKNLSDDAFGQKLGALIGDEEDDETGDEEVETPESKSAPAEETPKVADKASPADPKPEESVVDESALKALEQADAEMETKPAETPQMTSEQQLILSAIPSTGVARQLLADASAYQSLDTAINSGDFKTLRKVFAPQAWSAFLDDIYEENKETFVQRYVDEREGKAKPDPKVQKMQAEWEEFKAKDAREREDARQRQEREHAAKSVNDRNAKLKSHISALVSTVRTEDASAQKFVRGLIMDFLSEDSKESFKVRQQIAQGKYGGLTAHFRQSVVPEYQKMLAKQKAADAATETQRTQQQERKPIATPATASGSPDMSTPKEEKVELGSEAHWKKTAKGLGLGRLLGV